MYTGLQHAHSGLRWLILILIIVSIINSITNRSKESFTERDKKTYLFTMSFVHLQFLIGLVLYFISPLVKFGSDTMSNSVTRFYTVEHFLGMFIAIMLISVGYSKSKKKLEVAAKHKTITIFYGIALLLILASIPWPFRGLGAGWF